MWNTVKQKTKHCIVLTIKKIKAGLQESSWYMLHNTEVNFYKSVQSRRSILERVMFAHKGSRELLVVKCIRQSALAIAWFGRYNN